MHPVSARFLAAVRTSHTPVVRVDAYLGDVLMLADLPVVGGSVTVDSGSAVRRQLDLTIADTRLLPNAVDDAAPYGVQLRVSRGVRFSDGTQELVPLGRFRVDTVRSDLGAPLQVAGVDLAAVVADAKFLGLTQAVPANSIVTEITRLVHTVLPGVVVTNVNVPTSQMTPTLTWDSDPWTVAQDLAEGVGAEVWFDGNGTVTLRLVPDATDADPVWLVDAGDGGVLVTYSRQISRAETFNAVIASGERADAFTPVRAVVYDDDPASPTRWDGPFGHVPYFLTSPILTTLEGATAAATGMLNRKRALGRVASLTCVPNPALDAGDIIGVLLPDGTLERYLTDRVTIPLDLSSPVQVDARTPQPLLLLTDLPPATPNPGDYTPPRPETYAPDGSFPPIDYPPWEPIDGFPMPDIPSGLFPPMVNVPLEPPPFGGEWPRVITEEHILLTPSNDTDYYWFPKEPLRLAQPHDPFTSWRLSASLYGDWRLVGNPPAYGQTSGLVEINVDAEIPGGLPDEVENAAVWVNWTYLAIDPLTGGPVVATGGSRRVFLRQNGVDVVGGYTRTYELSLSSILAADGLHSVEVRFGVGNDDLPEDSEDFDHNFDNPASLTTLYPMNFPPQGVVSLVAPVTFGYLPQTLPQVEVALDGVVQATETYEIDYLQGIFTPLPAMGADVTQTITLTYTSNGEPAPPDDVPPLIPQLPAVPRRGGSGTF